MDSIFMQERYLSLVWISSCNFFVVVKLELRELPLLKYGDIVSLDYESSVAEIQIGFPVKRREVGFVVHFYEKDAILEVARNDPYRVSINPEHLPPLDMLPGLVPGGLVDRSEVSKRNAKLDLHFYKVEGIESIAVLERKDTGTVVYDPNN